MTDLSSEQIRRLTIEVFDLAATAVADPAVAEAWDRPSSLEAMTVGSLTAHLVRAAGALLAYVDRPAPPGELLDAPGYFRQAIEAPIHDRIKVVSADESAAGPAAIAEKMARVARDLAERLPGMPEDRMIGALGGRLLPLDEFCRTRFIEVLVHLDDLAASLGVDPAPAPSEATGEVIAILVEIARRRHGDLAVIRALSRPDRAPADALRVL